jgi:Protein of unknown function (DUF2586)
MVTGTPKVSVAVASGNLLKQILVTDGVPAIIGTAQSPENIGKINTIYAYEEALQKGYTEAKEPFLHRQIKEFYNELGGNMELWIMGVEDTQTMAQMLSSTNANGLKKMLNFAQGRINMVYVCRLPSDTYAMPAGFLDKDVELALLASKALGQYQQSINKPVRMLIEGRINQVDANPYYSPKTANNNYAGVVLTGSKSDGSASGALALARACMYPAHVKLGNGQNGPLSMEQSYLGAKVLEDYSPAELDNLSDAGYIITHRRDGASGYYFGVDNMAATDDFKILVHGRLIDKAQRVAAQVLAPFLETSFRIEASGDINAADAKYVEELVKSQIRANMGNQISDVAVVVPTNQDLINTSRLSISLKIIPLGYLTWIGVELGLTKKI